ncbi:hypothetical protein P1S91_25195, partial [Escherichia coli]|uniref:hypothetical protein n=1 Tax=Escherichia coli TaxID=562 RepID=UPI00201D6A22
GKGEALEIPHSPEKEPVSCLTDWHYPSGAVFLFYPKQLSHKPTAFAFIIFTAMYNAYTQRYCTLQVTSQRHCKSAL